MINNESDMTDANRAAVRRREHVRQEISLAARLVCDYQSYTCRVINISVGGARIRSDQHFAPGVRLALVLENFGELDCETVWQQGLDVGVRFFDKAETLAEVITAMAVYG